MRLFTDSVCVAAVSLGTPALGRKGTPSQSEAPNRPAQSGTARTEA